MREFIVWPPKSEVAQRLPIAFKSRYSNVQSIIDCFEIQILKPGNPLHQSLTWSEYKGCKHNKILNSMHAYLNLICYSGGLFIHTKYFEVVLFRFPQLKMEKTKSCNPATRKIIMTLVCEQKWTYQCSKTKVFNAMKHFKTYETVNNVVVRKKRGRKSTPRTDAKIVRMAKINPKLTSTDIKRQLFGESSSGLAARTIRKRLNEANLFGRVARKKPLISARNREGRIKFAREHIRWNIAQ